MEKIKYLPLGLFIASVVKGLINGFNWVDAPVLLILGLIAAYYEFKSNDKEIKKLNDRCEQLEKHANDSQKSVEEVKGYFTGMKFGQHMRSPNNVNK